MTTSRFLIAALLVFAFAPNAWCTEGGIGRPITGTGASPGMGSVPPISGPIVSLIWMQYSGKVEAERSTPIGGQVALGVEASFWMAMAQALYVWHVSPGGWSLASGVAVPYVSMEIDAALDIGAQRIDVSDDASSMYDIPVIPLIAGKHLSKAEHLSLSFTVWTPSGDYEAGKLANPGLNVWTFVPSLAYTKYTPDNKIEITTVWGVQFSTENQNTDYKSGVLSTLDLLAIEKHEKAGIGAVFGWIEQLTDDSGELAERLDGFQGRSFGIGPILTYSSKLGEMSFRWVNEFDTTNRPDGNVLQFSLTSVF